MHIIGQRTPHESICWRLGHYLPLQSGRPDLLVHVVSSTLKFLPGQAGTLNQVVAGIEQLFGLGLSDVEIRTSLDYLIQKKSVIRANADVYSLEPKVALALQAQEQEAQALEASVLSQWRKHLETTHPELSKEQIDSLTSGFIVLLRTTYQRLGAEAVHLFSGETLADWPQQIDLPVDETLRPVLLTESSTFFSAASPDRRQYLRQWFNGSLCIHTLYLDPQAAKVLRRPWSRGVLYVDSNLLYRVLGLQGPEREEAARALLNLSQEAGFQTTVTTRTIDELSTSLSKARTNLQTIASRVTTAAAERVLSDDSIGEDYYKAYCRARVTHGATVEQFNLKYSNLKSLMRSFKIVVDDVSKWALDQDDYYIAMLKELKDRRPDKPDVVQEHDAFHLRYVDKLRSGRHIQNLVEARIWFLTCDVSLVRYDERYSNRHHLRAPRSILADAWLAFVPSMVPAAADFDAAWSAYVMNPLFRSYEEVSGETAVKIAANLGVFQDNYEAMTEALQDQALRESVAAAQTPAEVQEAVEEWALRIADHFRAQAETALNLANDTIEAANARVAHEQDQAAVVKAEAEGLVAAAQQTAQEIEEKYKKEIALQLNDAEQRFQKKLLEADARHKLELAHGIPQHRAVLLTVSVIMALLTGGTLTWRFLGGLMAFWGYFLRQDPAVSRVSGYQSLGTVFFLLLTWYVVLSVILGAVDHFPREAEEGRTFLRCIGARMKQRAISTLFFLAVMIVLPIIINVMSPVFSRDLQSP